VPGLKRWGHALREHHRQKTEVVTGGTRFSQQGQIETVGGQVIGEVAGTARPAARPHSHPGVIRAHPAHGGGKIDVG
jgi:hypothetical protein